MVVSFFMCCCCVKEFMTTMTWCLNPCAIASTWDRIHKLLRFWIEFSSSSFFSYCCCCSYQLDGMCYTDWIARSQTLTYIHTHEHHEKESVDIFFCSGRSFSQIESHWLIEVKTLWLLRHFGVEALKITSHWSQGTIAIRSTHTAVQKKNRK